MSFISRLNKLGIKGAHKEYILKLVKDYQDEGLSPQEARTKAVQDLIEDTNEQIKDVSDQINEKGNRQHG